VKANLQEMTRALDAPPAHIRLFLLHGADESGSAALAKRLERACGADAERIDLDSGALKADPARLADEAASFSLFGGKRYIRIQPAGDEAVPAIEAMLSNDTGENPVIAVAGALKASSALLKLALASPAVLAFASYAPDGASAERLAETLGREAGLRLDRDTARQIAILAGNDRAIMAQEIEKLALYLDAGPERPVEAGREALDAVSAAASDGDLSRLVDAVMDGRPDATASELARLAQEGLEGIPLIRALTRRVTLLTSLRAEVDGGKAPGAAVEAKGKAIFWKEKGVVERQLGRWTSPRLATAAARLLAAERAIKASGTVGDMLGDNELIAISRAAARAR
jgi:DNA polymerase III subunit delta